MTPTGAVEELSSPGGASAPHMVGTVMGDYWLGRDEFIPSAALVAVLGELGFGADATRGALSRLCREGRLERRKEGRRTSYRLAPEMRSAAAAGARALARYGTTSCPWDGHWLSLGFSIPETNRVRRSTLRNRLRMLAMAPIMDGVWISPHDLVDQVSAVLTELEITRAVLLRATELPRPGAMRLVDAWDLEPLRDRLDRFGQQVDELAGRVTAGEIGSAEALVVRTDLMARWRSIAFADPKLPEELLPSSWPLRPVRTAFGALYDALGPLAELRIRQLAGISADDPACPRHHRLDDGSGEHS